MEPEHEPYTFQLHPVNHQPSGICDFNKIYNPTDMRATFTYIITGETVHKPVDRTEVIGENGVKTIVYKLPPPY